jgi:hypothetical protein
MYYNKVQILALTKKSFSILLIIATTMGASEIMLRLLGRDQFMSKQALVSCELQPSKECYNPHKEKGADSDLRLVNGLIYQTLTHSHSRPKVRHPFFGYHYNWKVSELFNRDGFLDSEDFSPQASENDDNTVRIGIFGGSFASDFAVREKRLAEENQSILINRIKQTVSSMGQKKFLIYNFAIEGHKQPQQFNISSFYSEQFDIAITIDGFNEVAYEGTVDFPVEYPNLTFLFYSRDQSVKTYIAGVYQSYYQRLRYIESLKATQKLIGTSYLIGNIWLAANERLEQHIQKIHRDGPREFSGRHPYYDLETNIDKIQNKRAQVWERFTYRQARFLGGLAKINLHFIQPNQHILGSKSLNEEESRLYYNQKMSPFINQGYALLEKGRERLYENGVRIFSLVDLYSNVKETVYVDDCCHINHIGHRFLVNEVTDRLIDEMKSTQ